MSELARIWLPFPPSVNNLFPTRVIKGRLMRLPSKQYRAWKKSADTLLMAARIKTLQQPVRVHLELTPRDNRARDADNYGKAVFDALVRCKVLPDDSGKWVTEARTSWRSASRLDAGVVVGIYLATVDNPTLPGLFDAQDLKKAG